MADPVVPGPTPQELAQYEALIASYGMTELWMGIKKYLIDGYPMEMVYNLVSNDVNYQAAYFKRFPAIKQIRDENAKRLAAGQRALQEPTPGQYIELERGYTEVLQDLPGTWDTDDNMTKWIASETSPVKLRERLEVAKDYINYDVNPEVRNQLRELYGVSDMDMMAYVLSDGQTKERLEGEWQKRMRQANVGAAARVQGIGISDSMRDQIASSSDQVGSFGNTSMTFANIAEQADSYRRLGAYSGVGTSTDDLVQEAFNLERGTSVTAQKKRLASQERARFSGSSAIGRTSLQAGGIGTQ